MQSPCSSTSGWPAYARKRGADATTGSLATRGSCERVADHEDLIRLDREPADRLIARQLGDAPAGRRLEPLLVLVEQRDRGDGRVQRTARQTRDALEALLDRRIEQVERMDVGDLQRRRARDGLGEEGVAHESPGQDLWRLGMRLLYRRACGRRVSCVSLVRP